MIKILHTGDIHLGSLTGPEKNGINLRREDTLRCMDEIVQTAREERPDLTIIAGDLFNRSRVWADTALDDVRDAVERLLRPLCECSGHVVLLFGTANHDNPKAFENIFTVTNDLDNLNVDTAPALYRLRCNDGSWVQIMSVPGFDKGRLRTFCPGMDKETENFNATALINDTIMGLAGRCDKSIPTIMTAHYTVAGAEADNGSTFLAGQDVVVLPATIDAAGVDLACLGHIHRPQKIACNTPAYYCGCINELTFNDEATRHGFYIHTMDGHGIVKSEFHELESSRKHYTMRIDRPQIMQFIADGTLNIAADHVYGKIVRVRYSCTSEEEKALNKAELQQKLMQMGAFYISDILPEDVEELDAKDQLTEHDGPTEALSRWLDLNNVEPWQKARLMELAAPIIAKADHGMDDGHSTGAFLPISIEVKNYRSYTDAAFSFEPVHMAMVNGANGVGKALQGKIKQTEMLAAKLPEAVEAREKGAAMKADANRLQQEVLDLARRKDRLLEEKNSLMQSLPGLDDTSDLERGRNNAAQVQRLATISLGSISAKLERIADAEEKAADLRETIKKTAKLLDDYRVLTQAFSLDGIQYMIVRGVVPEIMRRSNDILAAMTGGRMAVDIRTERELKSTKQIVNSLEVWISSINGGHRPYQSHSGGEKVKIALAVTLGLADVKAHRAGVQIGMLHIDEPPFLDAAGTEAYADALLNMAQRNPNMRILAISHDPTMKARFPQTITVEAGENGSTAYME